MMNSQNVVQEPAEIDDNVLMVLPKSLNINDKYLEVFGEKPSKLEKNLMMYFLTVLYNSVFLRKNFDKNGFTPLHSVLLKKVMGNAEYAGIIGKLVQMGVVEKNDKYRVKSISKRYRLVRNYFVGEYDKVKIKNAVIAANIQKLKIMMAKKNFQDFEIQQYTLDCLDKVELDKEKVKEIMEELKKTATEEEYHAYVQQIEAIEDRNFFSVADQNTGRVFHNLNNLKRELREAVLIEGEETTEIDINCSQPTFLSTLYPANHPEKEKYVKFLETKDFYSEIGGEDIEKLGRKVVKQKIFKQIFFGRLRFNIGSRYFRRFKKLFPCLAELVIGMKLNDHAALAVFLQSMEADAVVSNCIFALKELDIPAISIHDSILVKKSDVEIARKYMFDSVKDALGFEPKLTIKK